jgi:predicted Zn-dependent peptidase
VTSPGRAPAPIRRGAVAPGVRLHLLSTDRFATTVCRVVFHRDLGPEATATSLLSQVLCAATESHPTREALAGRLADLYGARLRVGVEKLGERQLLVATLDWPTRGLPGRLASLREGLSFLREAISRPMREGRGPALDRALVATESRNLVRSLRAVRDDKARYALRRCLETACAGEAFALDVEGRLEDVAAATPEALAEVHARLLATAPVDVLVAGDLGWAEAVAAVRRHLLWPGRTRTRATPPPASTRRPPSRARRLVETDAVRQGKLAMAWRADLDPRSPLAPAASVLAGTLGGTAASRLFRVVRETHGLCYYVGAAWVKSKGLLLVQAGIDPANARRVERLVASLVREVASGRLESEAHGAALEAARSRVRALADDRGSALALELEAASLGLDPRPERALRDLEAVTPADVRRAGRGLGRAATFLLAGEAP